MAISRLREKKREREKDFTLAGLREGRLRNVRRNAISYSAFAVVRVDVHLCTIAAKSPRCSCRRNKKFKMRRNRFSARRREGGSPSPFPPSSEIIISRARAGGKFRRTARFSHIEKSIFRAEQSRAENARSLSTGRGGCSKCVVSMIPQVFLHCCTYYSRDPRNRFGEEDPDITIDLAISLSYTLT